MTPVTIDVDENSPDDSSKNLYLYENKAYSTASLQYRKGFSNCKSSDSACEEISKPQAQSVAFTQFSGGIEPGSINSDSDSQLTEILHSNSTYADLQMIDRLIEYPELFPKLPSEKQAFVLYWTMFICEFLHREIEEGALPAEIIQNFEVKGRNYEDYRTDL